MVGKEIKLDNAVRKNETTKLDYKEMVRLYEEAKKLELVSFEDTLKLAKQALVIAKSLKNIVYEIHISLIIAQAYSSLKDYKKSIEVCNRGLSLIKDKHFLDIIDSALEFRVILATSYRCTGDLNLAINCDLTSLSIKKTAGTLLSLSVNYSLLGDVENAIKLVREGIEFARKEQSKEYELKGLYNLGYYEYLRDDLDAAESQIKQLMFLLDELASQNYIEWNLKGLSINLLGEIQARKGNYLDALEMFTEGIEFSKPLKSRILCELLLDRAKVHKILTNNQAELSDLETAFDYAEKYHISLSNKILKRLIAFHEEHEQPAQAYPYLKRLYEIQHEKITEYENGSFDKIINDRELEIKLLEEKNQEIQEQNAMLRQFAYIISHDLREPIRGITGFASILNKKYAESLDETANEYLRFILSEANSMNRNLARLLKYATIEKGTTKVEEVDISQIVTELKYKYQKESFELNITCKGEPLKMQPKHAKLLLEELIDNAVQFKKENEDCDIDIQCELKEGYYRLSVKDYGIGIDPIYHDKIFKIFNKINKHESKGAGVGLAICERIAQLYKGNISVESTLDKFTIFHIKIVV